MFTAGLLITLRKYHSLKMKGRKKTKETEVMGTVLEIVIVNDYGKWINSI